MQRGWGLLFHFPVDRSLQSGFHLCALGVLFVCFVCMCMFVGVVVLSELQLFLPNVIGLSGGKEIGLGQKNRRRAWKE